MSRPEITCPNGHEIKLSRSEAAERAHDIGLRFKMARNSAFVTEEIVVVLPPYPCGCESSSVMYWDQYARKYSHKKRIRWWKFRKQWVCTHKGCTRTTRTYVRRYGEKPLDTRALGCVLPADCGGHRK